MRPAGGVMKKFGAKRRMRFGHNKIVKRKPLKPMKKKGMTKGKSKFGKEKRKERMKERASKKKEKKTTKKKKEENLEEKAKEKGSEEEVTGKTETTESKKMISKVGVQKEKEIGATFRLGRFGAQFFAPVSHPQRNTASDNDDSDGEDVESEHSEDEVGRTGN